MVMKIYAVLDEKNRIYQWGSSTGVGENEVEIELDEGSSFFLENSMWYEYKDGKLERLSDEEIQSLIEEWENKPKPQSEVDILRAELEKVINEKKMSDLAILELTEILLGGLKGGE